MSGTPATAHPHAPFAVAGSFFARKERATKPGVFRASMPEHVVRESERKAGRWIAGGALLLLLLIFAGYAFS
jgi:hypothetical protein